MIMVRLSFKPLAPRWGGTIRAMQAIELPPNHPSTLADWLAHCERLHPQAIDMGLERVARVLALLSQTNRSWCVFDSANLVVTAQYLRLKAAA